MVVAHENEDGQGDRSGPGDLNHYIAEKPAFIGFIDLGRLIESRGKLSKNCRRMSPHLPG
jgi:hypothetical protein